MLTLLERVVNTLRCEHRGTGGVNRACEDSPSSHLPPPPPGAAAEYWYACQGHGAQGPKKLAPQQAAHAARWVVSHPCARLARARRREPTARPCAPAFAPPSFASSLGPHERIWGSLAPLFRAEIMRLRTKRLDRSPAECRCACSGGSFYTGFWRRGDQISSIGTRLARKAEEEESEESVA